jgi:hypothetical protein
MRVRLRPIAMEDMVTSWQCAAGCDFSANFNNCLNLNLSGQRNAEHPEH